MIVNLTDLRYRTFLSDDVAFDLVVANQKASIFYQSFKVQIAVYAYDVRGIQKNIGVHRYIKE